MDDADVVSLLPPDLQALLEARNGFILFRGGFHVRGACSQPSWHSIGAAWLGSNAFHAGYRSVLVSDIPFAEEATGDQFLLRDGAVLRLSAETDEVSEVASSLSEFLEQLSRDPVGSLLMEPFLAFESEGGRLEPGQLLNVYPPFCFAEAADGVRYAAVPAAERHAFLANLAQQVRELPTGASVEFRIEE